jgi:hypothetical protein
MHAKKSQYTGNNAQTARTHPRHATLVKITTNRPQISPDNSPGKKSGRLSATESQKIQT